MKHQITTVVQTQLKELNNVLQSIHTVTHSNVATIAEIQELLFALERTKVLLQASIAIIAPAIQITTRS